MAQSRDDTMMAQALADAVGATKRQIQVWTDAGVLQCRPETDRKGTGIRRQYEQSELPIAAFVAFLAKFKLQIGELQHYASFWREWLRETKRGKGPRKTLKLRQQALKGDMESWVIIWPTRMDIRDPLGEPLAGIEGSILWFGPDDMDDVMRELRGGIIMNVRVIVSPFLD